MYHEHIISEGIAPRKIRSTYNITVCTVPEQVNKQFQKFERIYRDCNGWTQTMCYDMPACHTGIPNVKGCIPNLLTFFIGSDCE